MPSFPCESLDSGLVLRRRTFLQGAAGLVGLTILGVPAQGFGVDPGDPGWDAGAPPGVARERIEGRAKVIGRKIFARDFNARDLGWGGKQWYAFYLCALTVEHEFLGVDLSGLPAEAQPTRVVLGNELSRGQSRPKIRQRRDRMVEQMAEDFDDPKALGYDLIVKPGAVPNYLGQGVALLLFDTLSRYRAARSFMQFRDADFQVYGLDFAQSAGLDQPYSPQTIYVKYREEGEDFSYASANSKTYLDQAKRHQAKIAAYLAKHPEFTGQDFAIDTQAMDPMFMEPESGIALYDGASQKLSVLVGTQSPYGDAEAVLSMYGEPDSPCTVTSVDLVSCYPGGGFGGRDSSPFTLLLALTAAYSGGNPVKLMHDRFDQFRLGLKRPGARIRGRLTCAPDMTLQCVEAKLDFNGGGLKNLSPYVANLAALCIGGSYQLPMADIFAQSVHTRDIPGGSQRGFGGPEAFLAIETALDDIAIAKGWDPIAFRKANLAIPSSETVVGGPIRQELRLAEMLDRAAAHPLWADRAKIKADFAAKGLTYGTGLAMSLQAYGTSSDGLVAAVLIEPDGAYRVRTTAVDMGNGSATTIAVVIGPILGANAAKVDMGLPELFHETGLAAPYTQTPQWSDPHWTAKDVDSSSACLTGLHLAHTVEQVARALMEGALLPMARLLWSRPDLKPDQVRWIEGKLTAEGSRPLSRAELAAALWRTAKPRGALGHSYYQAGWVSAEYPTEGGTLHLDLDGLSFYLSNAPGTLFVARQNTKAPDPATSRWSRYVWAPCVNLVGLLVDKSTGKVRIENVLSVLNAGRLLVPELVSGQSQGGVSMAIGYTLLEDMPDGMAGPANGTWNLNLYHVPRWQDVPTLAEYRPGQRAQELVTMPETPGDEKSGRGIAEAVMCSIAPAISNALKDATGKRFTSLPITPAKILAGLAS